jgi:hypothetical protein
VERNYVALTCYDAGLTAQADSCAAFQALHLVLARQCCGLILQISSYAPGPTDQYFVQLLRSSDCVPTEQTYALVLRTSTASSCYAAVTTSLALHASAYVLILNTSSYASAILLIIRAWKGFLKKKSSIVLALARQRYALLLCSSSFAPGPTDL